MAYVWFLPLSAVSAVSVPLSPPLSPSLSSFLSIFHTCSLLPRSPHPRVSWSHFISVPENDADQLVRTVCKEVNPAIPLHLCLNHFQTLRFFLTQSSALLPLFSLSCSQLCWSKATGLALYLGPPHSCSLPTSTPTPSHPC